MAKRFLINADGQFQQLRTYNFEQPYFLRVNDELFFLTGIYTKYNGVEGCSIVTREATLLSSKVHHRMSVILADYE